MSLAETNGYLGRVEYIKIMLYFLYLNKNFLPGISIN